MRRGSRQLKSILNYIDGQFVGGKREFADVNPADGSVIAEVAEADQGLVDDAVLSARKALRGPWGLLAIRERAARLHRVADAIEARFDCFVAAEVADTGKPVALASKLDVPRAAANFRVFADVIKTAGLESFQTEAPDGNSALNYAVRKPLGVVGIITPWNLPLLLLTWKVAPALACGNTVVVKPSEETPATATLLAEVMKEAGIPDGVYNVVHGFGPNSAGEFLTQHGDVNAVTFTGESQTGAAIMKTVAASVKPVSFELGGKNAAIVFADCDFEEAVNGVSEGAFFNTGQVCLCAERIYVERAIFDRFIEALKRKAESLRVGSPLEKTTDPRGSYMLIALPNVDGTFACILFLPLEGPDSFAQLTMRSGATEFFRSRFPDAIPLMPEMADNFFANPTGAMVTIKCSPWHVDGRALLLGDAAHAIVPFFGQGINCGFEDCTCLLALLDLYGADWGRVFREFQETRKINTDAIADLAVENFVEMRDRVADPRFLFRKKVELVLEAKYPRLFVPKYAMVTFHRIPYATALRRGKVQDLMLTELCERIDRVEDLDWSKADRLIRSELTPLELVS